MHARLLFGYCWYSGAWIGEIAFLEKFWRREQLQRTKTKRFDSVPGMVDLTLRRKSKMQR